MSETAAWYEGFNYFREQLANNNEPDIDDNPFECGDEAYYDWRDGFEYAEDD